MIGTSISIWRMYYVFLSIFHIEIADVILQVCKFFYRLDFFFENQLYKYSILFFICYRANMQVHPVTVRVDDGLVLINYCCVDGYLMQPSFW